MSFRGYSKYQYGLISDAIGKLSTFNVDIDTLNDNVSTSRGNLSTIESGNLNVPEYLSTFSSLSLFNTTASERADIISSTNLSRAIYELKISSIGFYNTEQDNTLSTLISDKLDNSFFNSTNSTINGNADSLLDRVSTIEGIKFDFLVHSTLVNTRNASITILNNSLTSIETNKIDIITFNSTISSFIRKDNSLNVSANDIENRKLNISTYNDKIKILDDNDIAITSSISSIESLKLLSSVYNTNIERLDGMDSTINNSISFLNTSLNNRISGVDTSISSIQSTIISINDKINNEVMSTIQTKVSNSTFSSITSTLINVNTEQFSTLETKVVSTFQFLKDKDQQDAINSKFSISDYTEYKNSRDSEYVSTMSSFRGNDNNYSNKLLAIDEYIITTLKTYEVDVSTNLSYSYTGIFQNIINLYPPTVSSTVPSAPVITSVTSGVGSVIVNFDIPADGGSLITGYTVTASNGTIVTGTSSPITVSGLTNGTSYTFTVVATNANGNSVASATSTGVIPSTIPDAPITVVATSTVNSTAVISFSAPSNNGGSAITSYTVTASDGTTVTGTSSPITVSGLTNGISYTFTVVATNANGNSLFPVLSPSILVKVQLYPVQGSWLDGISEDFARTIAVSPSGTVTVAGTASTDLQSSLISIMGDKPISVWTRGGTVVKYNSSGEVQWGKWLDGTSADYVNSVATDSSGNIYVVGTAASNLSQPLQSLMGSKPGTGNGAFLIKYNSAGLAQWGKWLDKDGTDVAQAVKVDSVGNIYIAGTSTADLQSLYAGLPSGTKPGTTTQGIFLIKFNSAGVALWIRWLDGAGTDTININTITLEGTTAVYITGTATLDLQSSFAATLGVKPTTTPANNVGAFIVKYSYGSGTVMWGKWMDGAGGDIPYSVATDSSGNVYVSGSAGGSFQASLTQMPAKPGTGNGAFLIKFNSTGEAQWGRWLDGTGDDRGYALVTDSTGNVFIGGYANADLQSTFAGTLGSKPGGLNGGAFLIKYDTNGTVLWGKWLDGTGIDQIIAMAIDNSVSPATLIVTGSAQTDLQSTYVSLMGSKPSISNINWGAILIKFDLDGAPVWGRWLDGTGNDDMGYSVAVDNLGNVIVAGTASANYQTSLASFMGPKPDTTQAGFMVNYNSLGIAQFGNWIDGLGNDSITSIATDSSGNVYVLGNASAEIQSSLATLLGAKPGTNNGVFFIKYNSAGVAQWGKWLDGTGSDFSNMIVVDTSGNIYITGTTSADLPAPYATLIGTKPGIGQGIFLIKFDSAGTAQWGNWIDGAANDATFGLAVDISGNVYVSGATTADLQSSLTSLMGSKPGTGQAGFLIKYDSVGVAQWGKWFDGTGSDSMYGVTTDSSGNVYVSGYTNADLHVTFTAPMMGLKPGASYGSFIVKYNTAGVAQWGKWLDGASVENNYFMATNSSGSLYVVGNSTGELPSDAVAVIGSKPSTSNGGYLIRYSSSGVIEGGTWFDGTGADILYDVKVDSSDNVYVCGYSTGNPQASITTLIGTKPDTNGTYGSYYIKYSAI